MKYLIDGYNWLFGSNEDEGCFYAFQNEFVENITRQLSICDGIFIVVFDGSSDHHTDLKGTIQIVYTQTNQTADEHILELLLCDKWKLSTVVTSDNALKRHAIALGAKVVSVYEFKKEQKNICKKNNSTRKPTRSNNISNQFYIDTFSNSLKQLELEENT